MNEFDRNKRIVSAKIPDFINDYITLNIISFQIKTK